MEPPAPPAAPAAPAIRRQGNMAVPAQNVGRIVHQAAMNNKGVKKDQKVFRYYDSMLEISNTRVALTNGYRYVPSKLDDTLSIVGSMHKPYKSFPTDKMIKQVPISVLAFDADTAEIGILGTYDPIIRHSLGKVDKFVQQFKNTLTHIENGEIQGMSTDDPLIALPTVKARKEFFNDVHQLSWATRGLTTSLFKSLTLNKPERLVALHNALGPVHALQDISTNATTLAAQMNGTSSSKSDEFKWELRCVSPKTCTHQRMFCEKYKRRTKRPRNGKGKKDKKDKQPAD